MGQTTGDRGQRARALAEIPAGGAQSSQPGAGRFQNTEHKRGSDSSAQEHLTLLARPAQEAGRRLREGDRRPRLWRPGTVRRPAVRAASPVSAGRAGRGPPRQARDRRTGLGPGAQQPLRSRRPRHGAVCPAGRTCLSADVQVLDLVLGGGPVLRTSAPVWREITLVPLSGPLSLSSGRVRWESSA